MSIILNAARIASNYHRDQKRKNSGRPYDTHLHRVGGRACSHRNINEAGAAAAFLHDIIEDQAPTPELYAEIKRVVIGNCGSETFGLVLDLTNPSKSNPELPRAERKRMDRAHIASRLPMVKIIKLIDRIDNVNEFRIDAELGLEKQYDFILKYCGESRLLLNEALVGADTELESELGRAISLLYDEAAALKG